MMHGLREFGDGYWSFVRRFTRNGLVQSITCLKRVTTSIGKGGMKLNILATFIACTYTYIHACTIQMFTRMSVSIRMPHKLRTPP